MTLSTLGMAFGEKISEGMIESFVDAPARRRKAIGDTVTNFVGGLGGKPENTGEPREATLLDSMKRLLGFDTAPAVHSETLTGLGAYPWELEQRDRNISRMRNTARARQIVLEERMKEQRRKRLQEKLYMDKLFETYDDVGGVPEGLPSYHKGNTLIHPNEVLDAASPPKPPPSNDIPQPKKIQL